MDAQNLYTYNLEDKYEWYDGRQIKSGLKPYTDYLKRVRKHYEDSKITLDYKPRNLQPSSGYLIDLGELGDNELYQVYDMDADSVYEFDLDDDTMQKFNAKNRIGIVRHNTKEKTLLLERKPNKRKLVLMRSSYHSR